MNEVPPRHPGVVFFLMLALCAFASPARGAQVDLSAGVLWYVAAPISPGTANDLTISLAGGTYTIDDPAEATLDLTPAALGAGCAPFDDNTVLCPAAAVTAIQVATSLGNDTVVLIGNTAPSLITAGDGADLVLGGGGDDSFVWNPGDDNDVFDGGPGVDTLAFNGSNVGETITITPDGTGFDLTRDVANVKMEVEDAEIIELSTLGGADTVRTAPLVETVQILRDGADAAVDTVTVDAQGLCTRLVGDVTGDRFETVGREPIHIFEYPTAIVTNSQCGALVDVEAGVLRYTDTAQVANRLRVTRSGESYLIDDPGEAFVTLDAGATAAGCTAVDANTATCPQAAVTSFEVATDQGDDRIDLAGALVGAFVLGGFGDDTIVGTAADDSFLWAPGHGNDTIDGGPGFDTLGFNGTGANDEIAIAPDGAGFVVSLVGFIASVEGEGTELLQVSTLGGQDRVTTSGLVATEQHIVDADDGIAGDALEVDALGLCVSRQGDVIEIEARQPIELARFTSVLIENVCRIDPCNGAVPTMGCIVNGQRNQPCVGTPGDDRIVGTKGDDVIMGGDGRDRIRAGDGGDLVCGEPGSDVVSGGPGDDTLVGGAGEDQLKGDGGNDIILGGRDRDVISGGTGDDELDGGEGDDRVRGMGGSDALQGGAGLDLLDGGPASDLCVDYDQAGPFPRCEGP